MEGCIRYSIQQRRYVLKSGEIKTSYVKVPYYVKNKTRNKKTFIKLSEEQTNNLLKIYNNLKYPSYSEAYKIFTQKYPDINLTYYHALKYITENA